MNSTAACTLEHTVAYALNIRRAESFVRALHLVFDFFSVAQSFIPTKTGYVVSMHEDILASVTRLNEAETFLNTEPLYFSAGHNLLGLISSPGLVPSLRANSSALRSTFVHRPHFKWCRLMEDNKELDQMFNPLVWKSHGSVRVYYEFRMPASGFPG